MTRLPTDIDLRELLSRGDAAAVREALVGAHPNAIAERLEDLDNSEVWMILRLLPPPLGGDVFANMPIERQALLATEQPPDDVALFLPEMAPDDRTDLVQELDEEARETILAAMSDSVRREIERLDAYEEDAVGAEMSTDYAALFPNLRASDAIDQLRRQAPRKETIYYAYVVDQEHRLIGFVSLKNLVLAKPDELVADIMRKDVISILADQDREDAARLIQEYDLLALPVVTEDGHLLGIVTVDDVIDVAQEEATEDFHRMAAISLTGVNLKTVGLWTLYRMRIPWLLVLVFMNIFSGAGIAYFEDTIAAVVALVFFLPLLIDSGGNAGAQSATLMIRSLAVGDVQLRDWLHLLRREIAVALVIGVSMGIAVSFIGFFRADAEVAVVVALSMLCIVLVGSLIGMSLPFLLARLKLDPATASAPLVTSLADMSGVLIYFAIATWYLADRIGAAGVA